MSLNDFLTSSLDSITIAAKRLNHNLNNNQIKENSFLNKFISELSDFLDNSRDIARLKQMPKDTMYKIVEDSNDYFIASVETSSKKLPQLDGFKNYNIFYIPKNMCTPNINESLYKEDDIIQEEMHYKNYLQLKNGVYTIVDKNGKALQ